jgi:hypothetical protein
MLGMQELPENVRHYLAQAEASERLGDPARALKSYNDAIATAMDSISTNPELRPVLVCILHFTWRAVALNHLAVGSGTVSDTGTGIATGVRGARRAASSEFVQSW